MNTLKTIAIGFISGLAGAYVLFSYQQEKITREQHQNQFQVSNYTPAETYRPNIVQPTESINTAEGVDFSYAATKATPSVVYINSISQGRSYNSWDWFFGSSGPQILWQQWASNPGKQWLGGYLFSRWLHCYQQPCY